MADNNESLDVNIASPVNGDASTGSETLTPQSDSYAAVLRGDNEHHHHKHHDHHSNHHLKARLEELERENAEGKEKIKAMDSIAKHAFELEGEVARLQHDLGTAINAGDEAGKEIERLNKEIDDLRGEKSALSEELGRKIGDLAREKESAEERAKARLDELEREIVQVKNGKNLVEEAMKALEAELKSSEEKVAQMARRIEELAKNTEESGEIIAGMVEKAAERGIDEVVKDVGFLKRKVSVPVVGVVSAGVVVAAVVVSCVRFSRMR